jgi:DNA-binding GntR family transcriptional regulator
MALAAKTESRPLNLRIVDTLRREIEDGSPAVGGRLPSEEA